MEQEFRVVVKRFQFDEKTPKEIKEELDRVLGTFAPFTFG